MWYLAFLLRVFGECFRAAVANRCSVDHCWSVRRSERLAPAVLVYRLVVLEPHLDSVRKEMKALQKDNRN